MTRTLLAAVAALGLAAPGLGQDDAAPSALQTAEAYLEAYSAMDWDRVEPMLADDMAFTDPTSFALNFEGAPFDWTGREEVISAMRSWNGLYGITQLEYDTPIVFEFAGAVVFAGTLTSFTVSDGVETAASAAVTTIVTVRDGLIAEHRDYVDYDGFTPVEPGAAAD